MLSIQSKAISDFCCGLPHPLPATENGKTCRLEFAGALTLQGCREFEEAVATALLDCRILELDLARVSEIDHYGIRLLELLNRVANREIVIVSFSPVVSRVIRRLFAPPFALTG